MVLKILTHFSPSMQLLQQLRRITIFSAACQSGSVTMISETPSRPAIPISAIIIPTIIKVHLQYFIDSPLSDGYAILFGAFCFQHFH